MRATTGLGLLGLLAATVSAQNYPGIIGGRLPAWVNPRALPWGLPTFRPCDGPIWDGSPCPSDSYCWNIGFEDWSLCRPYSMAIGNVQRPTTAAAPATPSPAAPAPTVNIPLVPDAPLTTLITAVSPVPAVTAAPAPVPPPASPLPPGLVPDEPFPRPGARK